MSDPMRPWYEIVSLHPDVEAGRLTMATFAIDFGGILANSAGVPFIYRDSRAFWQATHLTIGIQRLLEEVLDRLCGKPGDQVLQLRSPFGGGKSHVLVALYHAVKDRQALVDEFPECKALSYPGKVWMAGIDGEKFDPVAGTKIHDVQVHTLWGCLAAQLGCFDLVREQEKMKTAPGGETVQQMLSGTPILILLDEVLRYVERAMTIPIGESNLGRQALEFLQTLTTEVAGSQNAVMIYSLQASTREAFDNVGLLTTLDHLTARVDAKREPVIGDEILDVLKKRLLASPPAPEKTRLVANAIAQGVTRWKAAEAPDDTTRRAAQDEEIKFARRLDQAFPFHVGLIDLMKGRWASIPDFQRTRGALRFLAAVLHKSKKLMLPSLLVGPGDIPLDDSDVRNAFFTEVGQREPFQAVLEHDLTGPNARAKIIDQQMTQQDPRFTSIRPAARLATAILMYSFGGLQREEKGEVLPSGISEKELLEVCLSPEMDSVTCQSVLKRLRDKCLYLHYDGLHYAFKTIPNVNKILEDEVENVRPEEIRDFIRRKLEERIGAATSAAVIWPQESGKIPDGEPRFIMAYLDPEFSEKTMRDQEKNALEFLTQHGGLHRRYRNGLGLAVIDRRQLPGLRTAAKYLLAVERVRAKKTAYRLSKDQIDQLKEREDTDKAAFESGMRVLYPAIWLLKMESGQFVLEKHEIGGRPLREQGTHERLMELLKEVLAKLHDILRPHRLMSLIKLGKEQDEKLMVETGLIRDAFFQSLDFPHISSEQVLAKAIAQGVREGAFAYALKNRVAEEAGQYRVKKEDAAYNREISVDEIDFDGGVILLPECIIEPALPGPIPPFTPPPGPGLGPIPPGPGPGPAPPGPGITTNVKIEMRLTKQELYKTFNAMGNLAEKTGHILVFVEATKPDGFDRNWLRNAVKEPLEEAAIDVEITEE